MGKQPLKGEDVLRAKKLAEGPLGDELAKYPVRSATSMLLVGIMDSGEQNVKNATATLVDLGAGPLAMTCAHVISWYRALVATSDRAFCKIGNEVVDLERNLISMSDAIDVATISLGGIDLGAALSGGPEGTGCFEPPRWPPRDVAEGDVVCLGGFPGSLRTISSGREVLFPSFSVACARVEKVDPERLVVAFERDHWVHATLGDVSTRDLNELGGMSGGPVFIERWLHFELVGIISEYSRLDLLYASRIWAVEPDGTIRGCDG